MTRKRWIRALALLASALGLGAGLLSPLSCEAQECQAEAEDPPYGLRGYFETQGHFRDANTWESSPYDGDWVPYDPEVTLWIFLPTFNFRTFDHAEVEISADPHPGTTNDANYTIASGNLGEILNAGNPPGAQADGAPNSFQIQVKNDTCVQLYARVIVFVEPEEADASDAALADGGVDTLDGGAE